MSDTEPVLTPEDRRKPLPEWGWDEERQQLLIGAIVAGLMFLLFGGGLAMLGLGDDDVTDLAESVGLEDEVAAIDDVEIDEPSIEIDEPTPTVPDLDVETDVRGALAVAGLAAVGVAEGADGVITLTGEVDDEAERAEAVARSTRVMSPCTACKSPTLETPV